MLVQSTLSRDLAALAAELRADADRRALEACVIAALQALVLAALARLIVRLEEMVNLWAQGRLPPPRPRTPSHSLPRKPAATPRARSARTPRPATPRTPAFRPLPAGAPDPAEPSRAPTTPARTLGIPAHHAPAAPPLAPSRLHPPTSPSARCRRTQSHAPHLRTPLLLRYHFIP